MSTLRRSALSPAACLLISLSWVACGPAGAEPEGAPIDDGGEVFAWTQYNVTPEDATETEEECTGLLWEVTVRLSSYQDTLLEGLLDTIALTCEPSLPGAEAFSRDIHAAYVRGFRGGDLRRLDRDFAAVLEQPLAGHWSVAGVVTLLHLLRSSNYLTAEGLDTAGQIIHDGLAVARRYNIAQMGMHLHLQAAVLHEVGERPDSVAYHHREALRAAEAYQETMQVVNIRNALALRMIGGAEPGALAYALETKAIADTADVPDVLRARCTDLAARALVASGDAAAAGDLYREVIRGGADRSAVYNAYVALAREAIGAEPAAPARALAHADSARAIAAGNPAEFTGGTAKVDGVRGLAFLAMGRRPEARVALQAAVDEYLSRNNRGRLTLELQRALLRASLPATPAAEAAFAEIERTTDTVVAEAARAASQTLVRQYDDEKRVAQIDNLERVRAAQAATLTNRNLALGLGALALLGIGIALYDVARRRRALAAANARVTTLNRELNHRAANQINLAYQLIRGQQHGLRDERAREALSRSETQLMALKTVNAQLARSADDRVRADEVLTKVAEGLRAASPHAFDLSLDLAALELPAEDVTKVALVVNELIANSIKYAFADSRVADAGTVSLSLKRRGQRTRLTYADDGPGKDGTVRGTGAGSELIGDLLGRLRGGGG